MADDPVLYRARAAAERANAEQATLDNVRDRAERAAKAWIDMAEHVLAQREKREAATAARVAALAEA